MQMHMNPGPLVSAARPLREGFAVSRGGTRLYWRAEGKGPALLCSNGIGVSTFFWGPLATELSDHYTVIRWDYRGHGLSDDSRDPGSASIEQCATDALSVLDALEIDRAVLLGHSMGAQVHFEVYRQAPSRVAGLVPTLGTYQHAIETFLGTPMSLRAFEVLKWAIPKAPRLIQRGVKMAMDSPLADPGARLMRLVHPELAPREALVPYFAHNSRVDLLLYLALAESMQAHDASDLLPKITAPALVVAGDHDIFTPIECARQMVKLIPNSELFVIPGGTHAALIEQPLLLSLRVRQFLEEKVRI
jgi:pimeloyl-ACP methyl ester carboxylesterase